MNIVNIDKGFVRVLASGVVYTPDELVFEDETGVYPGLIEAARDLLGICKQLHPLCAREITGPHNTGSRPDICFVCAAIAKAKRA